MSTKNKFIMALLMGLISILCACAGAGVVYGISGVFYAAAVWSGIATIVTFCSMEEKP